MHSLREAPAMTRCVRGARTRRSSSRELSRVNCCARGSFLPAVEWRTGIACANRAACSPSRLNRNAHVHIRVAESVTHPSHPPTLDLDVLQFSHFHWRPVLGMPGSTLPDDVASVFGGIGGPPKSGVGNARRCIVRRLRHTFRCGRGRERARSSLLLACAE